MKSKRALIAEINIYFYKKMKSNTAMGKVKLPE